MCPPYADAPVYHSRPDLTPQAGNSLRLLLLDIFTWLSCRNLKFNMWNTEGSHFSGEGSSACAACLLCPTGALSPVKPPLTPVFHCSVSELCRVSILFLESGLACFCLSQDLSSPACYGSPPWLQSAAWETSLLRGRSDYSCVKAPSGLSPGYNAKPLK